MPRGKTTKRPPTIQERARDASPDEQLADMMREADEPIMTGVSTPAETTSTGNIEPEPLKELVWGETVKTPVVLLTLHLKRDGNEITDAGGTVHIPAPAMLPDGAHVRVLIFREEP